jgi:glycerophosphoryl diester phosphodiesterase
MGADYIELDLVSTKDHVLVARHENEISATTDVVTHSEFASRRATKTVDGAQESGWFTEDFTVAELKTLRAKERIPGVRPANTQYNGRFQVPTFEEVLDLRARLSTELGRPVGIAPETKHPTYFASVGLPLEPPMLAALRKADLDSATAPVLVQSFELSNLVALRTTSGMKAPTVFLLAGRGAPASSVAGGPKDYKGFTTAQGLGFLKDKVNAIGPEKSLVIPPSGDAAPDQPSDLLRNAHANGLLVVPFTFRIENQFLGEDYQVGSDPDAPGRAEDEQKAFIAAGVDGLFTDEPDVTVRARTASVGRSAVGPSAFGPSAVGSQQPVGGASP